MEQTKKLAAFETSRTQRSQIAVVYFRTKRRIDVFYTVRRKLLSGAGGKPFGSAGFSINLPNLSSASTSRLSAEIFVIVGDGVEYNVPGGFSSAYTKKSKPSNPRAVQFSAAPSCCSLKNQRLTVPPSSSRTSSLLMCSEIFQSPSGFRFHSSK